MNIKPDRPADGSKPEAQRHIEITLIVSNLALVAGTVMLLWTAMILYERQIKTDIRTENRFLTTEWHLLQELKAQTDRELREKDLEITELRMRYRSLSLQNQSPAQLRDIENQLQKAEAERASLFAERRAAVAEAVLTDTAAKPSATAPSAGTQGSTIEAAADRLAALPVNTLMAGKIQAENELLKHRITELELTLTQNKAVAGTQKTTRDVSVQSPDQAAIDGILLIIQKKLQAIDNEPPPRIEDVKTRSLVRAILGSAPIRKDYPDLLSAFDDYLAAFSRQESLAGQREAYTNAIEAIKKARE